MTQEGVDQQRSAHQELYRNESRWSFHYTTDKFVRFVRDRRLNRALAVLDRNGALDPASQSVLVVCGGVGGEGTYFANKGFRSVTVSDISTNALELCKRFDDRLGTVELNAERMDGISDRAFDLVVVQDGLHHLPRPALGFCEMLRVARTAAIVIEPYDGLVGRLIGTEWEVQGDAVNFVYRWTRSSFTQTARSYLLSRTAKVQVLRFWDHGLVISKLTRRFPAQSRLALGRFIYSCLAPFNFAGNMMVGVVFTPTEDQPKRLAAH